MTILQQLGKNAFQNIVAMHENTKLRKQLNAIQKKTVSHKVWFCFLMHLKQARNVQSHRGYFVPIVAY